MSRRHIEKKIAVLPDPIYNSRIAELFVRQIMRKGKKSLAYKLFYKSMNRVSKITKKNPLTIMGKAIHYATPLIETKALKNNKTIQKLPKEVLKRRGTLIAIRWILMACRKNKGKSITYNLANELIDASNKTGYAVKKKEEMHKMAEANKAFLKR
uniref:ribosomal protein S7 n=1 Tax=Prototheca fontanea TaxID=2836215 RepID=UPI0030028C8D